MQEITLPEKKYVASFDVHAQNTFTPLCPEELPIPEGEQIVAELNAQAQKASIRIGAKEAHNPKAVWVANENLPVLSPVKGKHVDVAWPVHSVPGTFGFELIAGLPHPTGYDYFIWEGIELDMHPYGACYHDLDERLSTGVIEFLRCHHITTVIVGGLALDYCVKTTVLQLLKAGFQVIVNLAASRGLAKDTSEAAVSEMKKQGAQFIKNAVALK